MSKLALLVLAIAGIAVVLFLILTGSEPAGPAQPERPDAGTPKRAGTGELPGLPENGEREIAAGNVAAGGVGSLLVLATDSAGAPVASVEVTVFSGGDAGTPDRRQTDAAGQALFPDLPAGTDVLLAVGGNGHHVRESRRVAVVGDQTTEVTFVIERGGAIHGRVVTEDGRSPEVAFRLLPVQSDRGSVEFEAQSRVAADGIPFEPGAEGFEIGGLAPGTWVVVVGAEDYLLSASRAVEVKGGGTTREVEVVLRRGATVSGIVVDDAGKPIAGATVSLGEPSARFGVKDDDFGWGGTGLQQTATDDGGRFRIGGATPGQIGLVAVAEGYAPGRVAKLTVAKGRETTGIVITLPRGGTLTGTVRDPDGKPIGSPVVLIARVWPGTQFHGEIGRRVNAGPDGVYRLEHLEPGRYRVSRAVEQDGPRIGVFMETGEEEPEDEGEHDGTSVVVSEGQVTVKDIVEAALAVIEGVVQSDTGRPLQKQVNLSIVRPEGEERDPNLELPNLTLTDPAGRFAFTGLEPGTYRLTVGNHRETLTVAGGETRRLSIRLPVFPLRGRVVDPEGKPVAGAEVYAQRRNREPGNVDIALGGKDVKTDELGHFTIPDLDPGAYTVAVYTEDGLGLSEQVKVGAGETVKGLQIVVAKLVRLRIELTDGAGQPLPGRAISLSPKGTEDGWVERTSDLGIAKFRLLPGRYRVRIYGEAGSVTPEEITLGHEPGEQKLILR